MEQKKQTRRRRKHHRRRSFSPPEPEIVAGEFVGKNLSELSVEELNRFLRFDARVQMKPPRPAFLKSLPPSCHDLSPYWFARYELERRKLETQSETGATLHIAGGETKENIALKVFKYGFRAAAQKYHPDHRGDTIIMQKVTEAYEFARERLKP